MQTVKVTKLGFYGGRLREPGEELTITDPSHFSPNWMEGAAESTGANEPSPEALNPAGMVPERRGPGRPRTSA